MLKGSGKGVFLGGGNWVYIPKKKIKNKKNSVISLRASIILAISYLLQNVGLVLEIRKLGYYMIQVESS